MRETRASDKDLGRTLVTVGPHPLSVLIGCIPGLVLGFTVLTNLGTTGIFLLFHPEIELRPGVRPFMWCSLLVMLLVLGLGLRHAFDRVQLCRDGFCFLGKPYHFEQMGPIAWSRQSQSGLTQFWDQTTMSFRYNGKEVRLRTRYLQDLSYQFHKVYGADGAGAGFGLSRASDTEIRH